MSCRNIKQKKQGTRLTNFPRKRKGVENVLTNQKVSYELLNQLTILFLHFCKVIQAD